MDEVASIKINRALHAAVKAYARVKGFKMRAFMEDAIEQKLAEAGYVHKQFRLRANRRNHSHRTGGANGK